MTPHFLDILFGHFAGGSILGGVLMGFINWTRD